MFNCLEYFNCLRKSHRRTLRREEIYNYKKENIVTLKGKISTFKTILLSVINQ